MQKTITAGNVEYTLGTITMKTAKLSPPLSSDDGQLPFDEFNRRLIAASLVAGGTSPDSVESLVDDLPIFMDGAFGKLLAGAMEVNGIKAEKIPASTGDTATAVTL